MSWRSISGITILSVVSLIAVLAILQESLLIIARHEFIDELETLKRFKNASGRPTVVLSLTEVYDNSNVNLEDEAVQENGCITSYGDTPGVDHEISVTAFSEHVAWGV